MDSTILTPKKTNTVKERLNQARFNNAARKPFAKKSTLSDSQIKKIARRLDFGKQKENDFALPFMIR